MCVCVWVKVLEVQEDFSFVPCSNRPLNVSDLLLVYSLTSIFLVFLFYLFPTYLNPLPSHHLTSYFLFFHYSFSSWYLPILYCLLRQIVIIAQWAVEWVTLQILIIWMGREMIWLCLLSVLISPHNSQVNAMSGRTHAMWTFEASFTFIVLPP